MKGKIMGIQTGYFRVAIALLCSLCLMSGYVFSQSSRALEEIIITAQKKEEEIKRILENISK